MKPRITAERLREVLHYDPELGRFTWRIRMGTHGQVGREAGTITNGGWRHIGISGVYYGAHRLAWLYVYGEWPQSEIDHKNLNKADNRLANLRLASDQDNSANRPVLRNNRLGVKGVGISTWRVRSPQRYRARIRVNSVLIHLGYFSSPEEASDAYLTAAKAYFGEFARSSS